MKRGDGEGGGEGGGRERERKTIDTIPVDGTGCGHICTCHRLHHLCSFSFRYLSCDWNEQAISFIPFRLSLLVFFFLFFFFYVYFCHFHVLVALAGRKTVDISWNSRVKFVATHSWVVHSVTIYRHSWHFPLAFFLNGCRAVTADKIATRNLVGYLRVYCNKTDQLLPNLERPNDRISLEPMRW